MRRWFPGNIGVIPFGRESISRDVPRGGRRAQERVDAVLLEIQAAERERDGELAKHKGNLIMCIGISATYGRRLAVLEARASALRNS
ncbi:MAG: hypothetical protein V4437_01935 [Patescibacteria group bacterium]